MEQQKSKVYVQHDADGRITRCEGGYTTPANLDGWLCIDEGYGDRYNLCQTHYFEGGYLGAHDIPLYKYIDGQIIPRTQAEINADYIPPPVIPTTDQRIADLEDAYTAMMFGGAV